MATPAKKLFQPIPLDVERVGKTVLDAAYRVHSALGPGLLESVYEIALTHVLRKNNMVVDTQVLLPIMFEGEQLESGLRLDMCVQNCVIVELKAVETMNPVYEAQLMTYLRLSGIRLGFLINFNVPHLKDGIKRRVV
jgi:GxxExxY protein